MKVRNVIIVFVVLALMIAVVGCSKSEGEVVKEDLVVLHAGSLAIPFKDVENAFEAKYPEYDVIREAAGSRTTVRKVTDLNKLADVVASADYTVIKELMMPEYTGWYANFATNEMAIMYTEESKFANEINADNWYELLLQDGVKYSHSEPNADPCGYRSQLVWQLAETYYNKEGLNQDLIDGCPEKLIRPKEVDLIAMLEAGELDYVFIYKSVAKQHKMPFVELPEEISLKSNKFAEDYKKVSFDINGKEPGEIVTKIGLPMVYGITIPNNAPNEKGAMLFMDFLLSEEGRSIMENNGQPPIFPVEFNDRDEVPEDLLKY
ncbi:MAG: tungstate ABC transporter substrate-binding protein WtpA [Bacillota bacterium]|nr:tungstate ABC transporter substrate-binding protein WtpA [Bacillota bacterium]